MLGRKIQTLLEVSREAKHPLFVSTVILVFVSIFKKSQASSYFEALNSAHLSKSQMDVRPSVQKRLRTMGFCRVSTADCDIPSSCEMKDEPAFKALQGKPAFFSVRASRGPIHLRQKTESLSHTYFRGKSPLEVPVERWLTSSVKDRESFSPQKIWGARKFSQAALMKLMILYT